MKLIKTLLLLTILSAAGRANAFEVDLSKGSAEALFGNDLKTPLTIENGQIRLPSRLSTIALPVQGLKKYKLEIDAQVHDDFVIEKNGRAHIMTLKSGGYRLSSKYSIEFFNAEGKTIESYGEGVARRGGTSGFFLSNKRYTYKDVFYTPEDARFIKVNFESNEKDTRIFALRLQEETAEGTVNTNPKFSYGELNYSGWGPGREGRLYVMPDGKGKLISGYRGRSTVFPLEEGKKYRIHAKGTRGRVEINYYDKKGKRIKTSALIGLAAEGKSTEFSPPQNTAMASLYLVSAVMEEVSITEIK